MTLNSSLLHEAGDLSLEAALLMANASQIVYEKESEIKNKTTSWGFDDCQFFDIGLTQGFIAHDDKAVLLSYRGSQSLGDWIANMGIVGTPVEGAGEIHFGFLQGYRAVEDLVITQLKALSQGRTVWLTGHSLGGALSTITAALTRDEVAIDRIYTFGQPRVGRGAFQQIFIDHYHHKFFRFVNNNDIVSKIPPNFDHVGQRLWFDPDGQLSLLGSLSADAASTEEELTQEEFKKLQADLKEEIEKAESESEETSPAGSLGKLGLPFEIKLQRLIPGGRAHEIDGYIKHLETAIA